MKILIVSDKEVPNLQEGSGGEILQGVDMIISCGDLRSGYLNSISSRANAPLFYVAGNHDFHYYYERPKGTNLDSRIVTFRDLRLAGFEGSIRYNHKTYQYTEYEMKKRVKRVARKLMFNPKIDIVVTHAPPFGIYENVDECHTGFQVYRWFIEKYQPAYFLHGHYHLDYGMNIEREHIIGNTRVINCVGYYVLEI